MQAIENANKGRSALIVEAFSEAERVSTYSTPAIAAAFGALAASFRTEADLWSASKKKGWQSIATRLREAAKLVAEVSTDLTKLGTDASSTQPNPHRAPLDTDTPLPREGFVYRDADATGIDRVEKEHITALVPAVDRSDIDTERQPIVGVPLADAIASAGDTLAYLRGDTDALPADLANKTLTVHDMASGETRTYPPVNSATPTPADVESKTLHEEAREMTQTFPMNLPGADDADPFSNPKPIAELMPYARPATYTPSGGRRLTFAELMTPPRPELVPDHWSWSQLETSENCGLRYRLTRVENLTHIPQWANIGGNAFHSATEMLDRQHADGTRPYDPADVGRAWEIILNQEITETAATSPVPIDQWRVSAGGKENQDWWRVEGEAMLQRFVEARMKLATEASPRKLATLPNPNGAVHGPPHDGRNYAPAIEWPFTITVDGPMGPLTYTGIVDRVWECADGTLLVEDLKSGSRMPKDSGQLGSYAWAVVASGRTHPENAHLQPRVMGTYYNARKGIWTPAVDLLMAHPWDELVYRLHSAEAKRRAGLYTPHVSDLCVACPTAYACPLRNREGVSA